MVRLPITVLTALAAIYFTLAAPLLNIHGHQDTPANTTLVARGSDWVDGSINFFPRDKCENHCNGDPGFCLGDDNIQGGLNDPKAKARGDWSTANGDATCWNIPAGTKSISLATNNDHGYVGSNLTCDGLQEYADKPAKAWKWIKWFHFESGEDEDRMCNGGAKVPERLRSISYQWDKAS